MEAKNKGDKLKRGKKKNIHPKTKAPLKIIRLPILNKQRHHKLRQKERHSLKQVEMKRHISPHNPPEDNQEGRDK